MNVTLKSLGIDQMSVAERIHLAEEIWNSIIDEAEVSPLTVEQREDLKRRLAGYEANPNRGSPWEEVKAKLQSRSSEAGSLLTDWQRQELLRRAAEDEAKPDDVVTWEQAKAKALRPSYPPS